MRCWAGCPPRCWEVPTNDARRVIDLPAPEKLGLPAGVWRKVTIGVDGRPSFAALSDPEFDAVLREVRRVYPLADPAQGGCGSVDPGFEILHDPPNEGVDRPPLS